eukprot:RCo049596
MRAQEDGKARPALESRIFFIWWGLLVNRFLTISSVGSGAHFLLGVGVGHHYHLHHPCSYHVFPRKPGYTCLSLSLSFSSRCALVMDAHFLGLLTLLAAPFFGALITAFGLDFFLTSTLAAALLCFPFGTPCRFWIFFRWIFCRWVLYYFYHFSVPGRTRSAHSPSLPAAIKPYPSHPPQPPLYGPSKEWRMYTSVTMLRVYCFVFSL